MGICWVTGAALVDAGGGCAVVDGVVYGFTSVDGRGERVVPFEREGVDSSAFALAEACGVAGFGGASRV